MNRKIEAALRENISTARSYVKHNSIKESIEEWKEEMRNVTWLLEQRNDPSDEDSIKQNYATIDYFYNEFISALANEEHYNTVAASMVRNFDQLDENRNTELLVAQLKVELPKLRLVDGADSLYGIFFEYDSSPVFGVTCFPKQPFEIIIGEPKYVNYEIASYASDVIIEIDFTPIGRFLFSEEFNEMNEPFEFELKFISQIKEMYMNFAYLCLHQALKQPEINNVMNMTPIHPKALFYAMQHDCEHRTIFVRE